MIKILFFIEKLDGGGAEKVLRNLVNHMDQSQFEITVQTVWPFDASKYLAPGIRYKSVYTSNSKVNQLRYRAEAESGLTYRLHMKDDYDIECAYLEMGATKILASSTNRKAKKLAWVHCDFSHAFTDFHALVAKTAPWYQKYDRVICVSNSVKEAFDRVFNGAFHSDVLYNVVEDDVIRQKAKESIPDVHKRRLTVLAVGTIYPPKNYPRLLKAHERLMQEGIVHDLWILGDGEQRTEIEQYIREHDLTDSVTLFGFQKNPYPYMNLADVIVCPSNYEGFSTVITESTILGKAIVTTDCSGMREILGDNEYGIITENKDDAFFDAMRTMIIDDNLRNHYAKQAEIRGKRFSMSKLVSETQDYLKKVVEK